MRDHTGAIVDFLQAHALQSKWNARAAFMSAALIVLREHTMFMIAEADDETGLQAFMAPFREAGSVDVFPASTCAGVVASNGCAAPSPGIGEVPALDPEEACQDAIDAELVVHRAYPLNCETSVPALIGGVIMPNARFYVRNHFQIPNLNITDYRLACSYRAAEIGRRHWSAA